MIEHLTMPGLSQHNDDFSLDGSSDYIISEYEDYSSESDNSSFFSNNSYYDRDEDVDITLAIGNEDGERNMLKTDLSTSSNSNFFSNGSKVNLTYVE